MPKQQKLKECSTTSLGVLRQATFHKKRIPKKTKERMTEAYKEFSAEDRRIAEELAFSENELDAARDT
jgi:hypothetical protein